MTQNAEDQANEVRASFQRTKEAIAGDRRLTEEAKGEAIAAARTTANASLAELMKRTVEARRTERARLERLVFSAPPAPLGSTAGDRIAVDASYRDALDRARRTSIEKPEELLELFNQAEMVGDRLLSRAAMVVAFDRGHVDVINGWTDANPGWREDVERLWDLRQTDLGASLRDDFALHLAFSSV